MPKFSLDELKEAFEGYDKVRIWEIRQLRTGRDDGSIVKVGSD